MSQADIIFQQDFWLMKPSNVKPDTIPLKERWMMCMEQGLYKLSMLVAYLKVQHTMEVGP